MSRRQGGAVLLDGRDIRTLRLESLHGCMAVVSQVPVLQYTYSKIDG